MKKGKIKLHLKFRVRHALSYHPWLKLVSLVLAIMLWFYVSGEISKFNYY